MSEVALVQPIDKLVNETGITWRVSHGEAEFQVIWIRNTKFLILGVRQTPYGQDPTPWRTSGTLPEPWTHDGTAAGAESAAMAFCTEFEEDEPNEAQAAG
jgi:hypothetical protein